MKADVDIAFHKTKEMIPTTPTLHFYINNTYPPPLQRSHLEDLVKFEHKVKVNYKESCIYYENAF